MLSVAVVGMEGSAPFFLSDVIAIKLSSEDLALWQELARDLRTPVVAAFAAGSEWSFAVFGPEGLLRAVVVDGEEVIERGEPLPIEQLFSGRARLEDLTLLVSSFGVDFERTNLESCYRLVEVEVAA